MFVLFCRKANDTQLTKWMQYIEETQVTLDNRNLCRKMKMTIQSLTEAIVDYYTFSRILNAAGDLLDKIKVTVPALGLL